MRAHGHGSVGFYSIRLNFANVEIAFVLGFLLPVHEVALNTRDKGLVWRKVTINLRSKTTGVGKEQHVCRDFCSHMQSSAVHLQQTDTSGGVQQQVRSGLQSLCSV